jgi:hypothetical protein
MAGVLRHFLENSSPTELLELLSRYLGTLESKRDSDFFLSLKSMLITLKEHDKLLDDVVCRVTRELCLPSLQCGNSLADRNEIHIVYEVVALCCVVGPKNLVQEITSLCLEGLANHTKDVTTSAGLPVVVCVDLMSYLMKDDYKQVFSEDQQRELFDSLLNVLWHSDELMSMKITSCVLPLFLSLEMEDGQHKTQVST